MDEKRGATRWRVTLPVRYFGASAENHYHTEGVCRTRDFSMLGARLAMIEKQLPGNQIRLMVEVPESNKGPLCIEADVVWQLEVNELYEECNYLTGVVFTKIRDYHKQWLLDYVNSHFPEEFRANWWNGLK